MYWLRYISEFKARISGAWLWRDYAFSTHLGYISSYRDEAPGSTVARIDSFLTWDFTVQWELPTPGLRLALSALNITDSRAPTANLEQGFDGFTHTAKGRRYKPGACAAGSRKLLTLQAEADGLADTAACQRRTA